MRSHVTQPKSKIIQFPAVQFNRVSSADQESNFSLKSQDLLGEQYAKRTGLKVIKEWSEVESASKEASRKHFFEMVEYVKENNVKHVIFDKVDRAVRGFKSAVIVEEMMEHYGVKFHFTRENLVIDTHSSPAEKMRFYLSTILAKYYIDNLRVEIKKGTSARLDAGHWNWKAPLGYVNHRDGDTKRALILIDPVAGPAVKEIFETYATGNRSLPELIATFNQRTGQKKEWKVLEKIISNPFYYGMMKVKGELIQGIHEALISKALWVDCQRIRGIRAAQYSKNDHKRAIEKPFMGLMLCSDCGHRITGETVIKNVDKVYIYYRCSDRGCKANGKRVSQEKIHLQLNEAFKPFARITPVATEALISVLKDRVVDLRSYTNESMGRLGSEVAETESKIIRLNELLRAGQISQAEHDEWATAARSKLNSLENEGGAHWRAGAASFEEGLRIIQLLTKVSDYSAMDMDLMKKSQLAKILLSNISLDRGTLRFNYVKPLDDLLEITNGRFWWTIADSGQTCPKYLIFLTLFRFQRR
jgi:DNA invertase Pin-like site-specific DNA recombinase